MIQERTISLGAAIAAVLWGLTVVLIVAGAACAFSVGDRHPGLAAALMLMSAGLSSSAAAATVTIRNMIHNQNKLLRDAFRLGEESGQLRRVRS